MATPGTGVRMKLDIKVVDTLTDKVCADVVIDWFETIVPGREPEWCKNVDQSYKVQFPAPSRVLVYYEAQMLSVLEKLLGGMQQRGLKSVVFPLYNFKCWDFKLFVPVLLKAAYSTNSDARVFLCTFSKVGERRDYLKSAEFQKLCDEIYYAEKHVNYSDDKEVMPVNRFTYNHLKFFENDSFKAVLDSGCVVLYNTGNLEITGKKAKECREIIRKAISSVNNIYVDTVDTTKFNDKALADTILMINRRGVVNCLFNDTKPLILNIYGKTFSAIDQAKKEIEKLCSKPASKLPNKSPVNVGQGQTPRSAGKLKSDTRSVRTFWTKENILVKVYVGDILYLDVDCIVNAANTRLSNEGGIAEVIAKAAGKDFKSECKDYIRRHKQLDVGGACLTTAGDLKKQYKCIVHTVGPRWEMYKPYTQKLVDRCKNDLKSAIIESLKLVSYDRSIIKTIAFPAISSGKFRVPRELCCMQYAEALIEYSKNTVFPLQEVHFVDTNTDMIKLIGDTFDSMFNHGKPPSFYNEKMYVTRQSSHQPGHRSATGSQGPNQPMHQHVTYPYCTDLPPPGHASSEFTCVLGPNQNVYIYTKDILKVPKIDLIVCGDIPNSAKHGKRGFLAQALWETCGERYQKNKLEAFKDKSEGDVVFCKTGKYKFAGHVLLVPKKTFKSVDERQKKVNDMFRNIFRGMKEQSCRTMALPLIGTGAGSGDPNFYAERFIESLIEFCSFSKSFNFDIHLVNMDSKKTATAIDVVKTEIDKQRKANRTPPARPPKTSGSDRQTKPQGQQRDAANDHQWKQNNTPRNKEGFDGRNNYDNWRPATAGRGQRTSKPAMNDDRRNNKERRSNGHTPTSNTNNDSQGRGNWHKPSFNRSSSVEDSQLNHDEKPWENMDLNKSKSVIVKSTRKQPSPSFDSPPDSPTGADSPKNIDIKKKDTVVGKPKGNLNIFEDDQKLTHTYYKRADTDSSRDNGSDSQENVNDDNDGNDDDGYDPRAFDDDNYDDYEHMDVDDNEDASEKTGVVEEPENCVICMDTISASNCKTLPCGHQFCTDCIDQQFVYKEACPTCGFVCGVITGDQPDGKMDINIYSNKSCSGYEDVGRIEITYSFRDGRQGPNHPEPGKFYKGIRRTAYLPHNKQGKVILEMLRVAFHRKLIFTIGRSRTTGADSVITWNDIHHKTDPKPHSQFGYPDPTYLDRVTDELKAKGVTEDDIPQLPNRRR